MSGQLGVRRAEHRILPGRKPSPTGRRCGGTICWLTMNGLHLTADLHTCRCSMQWLTDANALGKRCVSAVNAAGLQGVAELFHTFPATPHGPGGVTATVLLAESHLCVHTWPEQKAVTLDVYVCNFGGDHSGKAHALMEELIAAFEPGHVERHQLTRGEVAKVVEASAGT